MPEQSQSLPNELYGAFQEGLLGLLDAGGKSLTNAARLAKQTAKNIGESINEAKPTEPIDRTPGVRLGQMLKKVPTTAYVAGKELADEYGEATLQSLRYGLSPAINQVERNIIPDHERYREPTSDVEQIIDTAYRLSRVADQFPKAMADVHFKQELAKLWPMIQLTAQAIANFVQKANQGK